MLHQGHCPSPGVLDTPLVPPVTSAGPYRAPRWSEPSGIAQRGGCLNVSSEQNPQFSIVVVQLLSRVRLSATPWTAARQASLSITKSQSSNSCPSSQGCHPTISSSVVPFSSCLQSSPASGSFLMSQFFISGGQSIGVSIRIEGLIVHKLLYLQLFPV